MYFFMVLMSTFVIDRITKYLALSYVAAGVRDILPGLSLHLAVNTGVSFSLFASKGGSSHWVLTTLVAIIVALLVILWRFFSTHSMRSNWAYGLIIGGAIGNFYDRLYFGGVIDFIDVYYRTWHWPTFNVADMAIACGFIFLIWETYCARKTA